MDDWTSAFLRTTGFRRCVTLDMMQMTIDPQNGQRGSAAIPPYVAAAERSELTRPAWRAAALFVLLACLWSWPLFWLREFHSDLWQALPVPAPLRMTLVMWGPGLAALVCWRLFRARVARTASLLGGAPLRALAFYFVPLSVLAACGTRIQDLAGWQNVHAIVLAIAVVGFVNTLGEELGWRGFLRDSLAPLSLLERGALSGLIWAAWHFTNLFAGRQDGEAVLAHLAWYVPLTIVLSILLDAGVSRSRALVVAITWHTWMNLAWELGGSTKWWVLAAALPFWALLLATWPRPER